MDKKIILYGTGTRGEIFYWKNIDKIKIAYCIDVNTSRSFHGLEVYSFAEKKVELKQYFIVIAAVRHIYIEISNILFEAGLVEGADFIWDDAFDKELVFLYGTCHVEMLSQYLKANPYFSRKYYVLMLNAHYWEKCPIELLKSCKVFITQDIGRSKKGNDSADTMEKKVGEKCIKIRISHFYDLFHSLFPQIPSTEYPTDWNGWYFDRDAIFEQHNVTAQTARGTQYIVQSMAIKDSNIENLFQAGVSVKEIADSIEQGEMFNGIKEKFTCDVENLIVAEKQYDIKLANFIKNNYRDHYLFRDLWHPTLFLYKEAGRQILKILNIPAMEEYFNYIEHDWTEVFTYGCVKKALNMSWEQSYIRGYNYERHTLLRAPLTREDYVRQYLLWRFGKVN